MTNNNVIVHTHQVTFRRAAFKMKGFKLTHPVAVAQCLIIPMFEGLSLAITAGTKRGKMAEKKSISIESSLGQRLIYICDIYSIQRS